MKKLIIFILLFTSIAMTGCENKKAEQTSDQTQTTTETTQTQDKGKLLFTINGREVYEKDARIDNIDTAINDEILYESAIIEGIDKQPEVERSLNFYKKNLLLGLLKRKIVQDYLKNNEISQEDITKYYNENIGNYTVLDLSVISAPDEPTADEIKAKLVSGQSPESVVDDYKKAGKEIKINQLMNNKKYNDQFDKLEPGTVSDPIQQGSAYLVAMIEKSNVVPLEKVTKSIRYSMVNDLKSKAVIEYIEKSKKDNKINIELAAE